MSDIVNITLVQADLIWEDEVANLKKFDHLLSQIHPQTDIVILPEMFATGFTMNVKKFNKPVGNQPFEWLKKKSAELNKIIVGSLLTEAEGKYYNRMYWMRPDATFEYYDKRHLFQMGDEDKVMTAGNRKVFVAYKNRRFQLQICYDLRFPVWVKNNYDKKTGQYDYDAIIYVANWPETRKQAYTTLLKARAIENQSFVIWVNRVGVDAKNIAYSGDSQVLDPHGNSLIQATSSKEEIISLTIDFSVVDKLRNAFNAGQDWDRFKFFT